MEPQTNTTSPLSAKNIFVLAFLLIISSAIGAVVGGKYYPQAGAPQQTQSQNQQVFSTPLNTTFVSTDSSGVPIQIIHTIDGKVKEIDGNRFTLRVQATPIDQSIDYTVSVTSKTKIVKISEKDPSIFAAEFENYTKMIEAAKKVPRIVLPLDIVLYTTVQASEIAIGDNVNVSTPEDINTRKDFTATEVEIRQASFGKVTPGIGKPTKK